MNSSASYGEMLARGGNYAVRIMETAVLGVGAIATSVFLVVTVGQAVAEALDNRDSDGPE